MASSASQDNHLVTPFKPVVQTSKLLALPAELLDIIFKDVYAQRTPPGPICRALLRFGDDSEYHREGFRRVRVIGTHGLSSYCKSLEIRSSIGAKCESFTVFRSSVHRVDDLPASQVSLLLSSLHNLNRLVLRGEQLVKEFLDRAATNQGNFMPHLGELDLEVAFADGVHPYHPSYLKGLATFINLRKLSLSLTVDDLPGSLDKDDYALVHLQSLTFTATTAIFGAADLVKRCPGLSELHIADGPEMNKVSPILAAAANLKTVTHLSLEGASKTSWKLPKELKSFTTLKTLVVGRGCTCRDKPSFALLRRVPFTALEFGAGSIVSASHLLGFITGDEQHPTLVELELNNVEARSQDVQSLDWREERGMLYDWLEGGYRLPMWAKTFSRKGLEALVGAAERERIELSGDAVEAPEIEDQIHDDKEKVEGWMEREDRREWRHKEIYGRW
ncbi:hypothetical protein JCM10450v2_002966 [Rhodotorula kratochvilovae]